MKANSEITLEQKFWKISTKKENLRVIFIWLKEQINGS